LGRITKDKEKKTVNVGERILDKVVEKKKKKAARPDVTKVDGIFF